MKVFTDTNFNEPIHNWASSMSDLLFVSIMLVLALPARTDEADLQQNLEGIAPQKAEPELLIEQDSNEHT